MRDRLATAERALWQYGREVVGGIADYIEAAGFAGDDRRRHGETAIARIGEAITEVRGIDLRFKGTWGAYDLEWARDNWLAALRRRFGGLKT